MRKAEGDCVEDDHARMLCLPRAPLGRDMRCKLGEYSGERFCDFASRFTVHMSERLSDLRISEQTNLYGVNNCLALCHLHKSSHVLICLTKIPPFLV